MTIGEWLTGPARGHDMSEMGPTEQHARDYIAKLEARIAELESNFAVVRGLVPAQELVEAGAQIVALDKRNAELQDELADAAEACGFDRSDVYCGAVTGKIIAHEIGSIEEGARLDFAQQARDWRQRSLDAEKFMDDHHMEMAETQAKLREVEAMEHRAVELYDEAQATIRRLSDENAALKSLLADLGGGPVAIYGADPTASADRGNVRAGSSPATDRGELVTGGERPAQIAAIYGTDFPECPDAKPYDLRGDVDKLRAAWARYGTDAPACVGPNDALPECPDKPIGGMHQPVSAMLWCATCNTMHLGDCPKAEPPAEGLVKVGKFWLTPEDAKRARDQKR